MDNLKEDFEVNDEFDVNYNPPILEDNNFLIDKEELEKTINPFEGDPTSYAFRYWEYYTQLQNKEYVQRIYNIGKITKEEFVVIVGENPKEKEEPKGIILDVAKQVEQVKNITDYQDISIITNQMETALLTFDSSNQDISIIETNINLLNLLTRVEELENKIKLMEDK